jgi:arylsulfatase A-like enzyme
VMQFTAQRDDDLPDGQMATAAIAKLKDLKQLEQPFFMGLGFFKPHLPFVAPQGDWDAFEGVEIPLPTHGETSASLFANNKSNEFFKYDFPYDKTRPLSDEKVLINRRAYLACLRYTDRQIGRVLEALDNEGLTDSTIVVLWSDHGWNLGDSRQWAKHTALERAVRSPLMISVPGMGSAGKQSDSLVETIDVFPTLIDLCHPSFTKIEKRLDGKSLVPILDDPQKQIKEVSFSYWRDSVSVRTKQFRLIAKIADKQLGELDNIELYSSEQQFDPVKNMADQYPDAVDRLVGKFKAEAMKVEQ